MPKSPKITICRTTLKALQYSLIWPSEDQEINPNKWFYVRLILFVLITSGWIFGIFMHIVVTIKHKRDISISEDVAFISSFLGIYMIVACFVKNQKKLAQLLADLSDFDRFGVPPTYEIMSKKLSFYSKFCFMYVFVGIFVYNYFKYWDPTCERINAAKGYHENCRFLTPLWTPFPADSFPVWHLIEIYVLISSQILMKLGIMVSYIELETAHYIIMRIDHLNGMLIECFANEDDGIRRVQLNTCIEYHKEILDFSARLDDCFLESMFSHLIITGTTVGCLEYQFIMTSSKIPAFLHIFGWTLALFIACLGGQQFTNAGESLVETIYNTKWYTASVPLQQDLALMLLRSQKGLQLKAGPFGFLGFPLFVSVLKMSYSILAVLNSRN